MIGIGLIGYGYWGPNLVRNFSESSRAKVIAVSDLRTDALEKAQRRYPSIETLRDADALIADPKIDAVMIATPVSTHFELALKALKAGKHVLVEKPMTMKADEARRLIDASKNLTLMVDHTFIYTPAVQKIHALIAAGDLGDIYYYDSVRINLGLFQHDVDVIWDLAVHDLSILDFLLDKKPKAVSATGKSHLAGQPANIAYLTLFFDDALIAHIHANWLAPVKIRRTLIGGSKKMVLYDDLEPSEKIKIYDKGIIVSDVDLRVGYRTGDMCAPQIQLKEALATEAEHFLDCVENGTQPLSDGHAGLRVVEILEAATRSMAAFGAPVDL